MLFTLCYIVSLESYSNGKSNDLYEEIRKKPEVILVCRRYRCYGGTCAKKKLCGGSYTNEENICYPRESICVIVTKKNLLETLS